MIKNYLIIRKISLFYRNYSFKEELIEFLNDMFKQSVDKLQASPFQSLLHNDLWIQNIMFSSDLVKQLGNVIPKKMTVSCRSINLKYFK